MKSFFGGFHPSIKDWIHTLRIWILSLFTTDIYTCASGLKRWCCFYRLIQQQTLSRSDGYVSEDGPLFLYVACILLCTVAVRFPDQLIIFSVAVMIPCIQRHCGHKMWPGQTDVFTHFDQMHLRPRDMDWGIRFKAVSNAYCLRSCLHADVDNPYRILILKQAGADDNFYIREVLYHRMRWNHGCKVSFYICESAFVPGCGCPPGSRCRRLLKS